MAEKKEASSGLEWRIRVENGTSEILVPECDPSNKAWVGLHTLLVNLAMRLWKFFKKAWDIGVEDPKKVIHCLKVGIALTVVSLFYYMRPLYEGVGGNAMWAVMTVVVVFEYTVGASLCKCLNRICGTCLAGFLAIGIHWTASQSGEQFGPIIVGTSVFLLASAATFSRFIPVVKARFDYGAMIFILTFSLVSVSGYRVEKLFDMAHNRMSTIIIGTSLCITVSMLVCPIWAGTELFLLITCNMDKLANSLDCCVAEYFIDNGGNTDSSEESDKKLQGYKCVLNSKATEESMAGFARWEPAHGRFGFQHPWKQYLKIGESMRNYAYCIEALSSILNSEDQTPEVIKKHLHVICLRVSSNTSNVIRELAMNMNTMRKSSKVDISVEEMNSSVQELQDRLKSLPSILIVAAASEPKNPEKERAAITPIVEVIPLVTFASLLIEIAAKTEGIVVAVEELANLAEYKPEDDEKAQSKPAPITRL